MNKYYWTTTVSSGCEHRGPSITGMCLHPTVNKYTICNYELCPLVKALMLENFNKKWNVQTTVLSSTGTQNNHFEHFDHFMLKTPCISDTFYYVMARKVSELPGRRIVKIQLTGW